MLYGVTSRCLLTMQRSGHSEHYLRLLLPLPAQANYAAANAALDAFAAQQAAVGVAAVAVQWGAWSAVGECLYQQRPDLCCSP